MYLVLLAFIESKNIKQSSLTSGTSSFNFSNGPIFGVSSTFVVSSVEVSGFVTWKKFFYNSKYLQ